MNKFWVLQEPEGADAAHREAKWNHSDLRYERIRCPIEGGHAPLRSEGEHPTKDANPARTVRSVWELAARNTGAQLSANSLRINTYETHLELFIPKDLQNSYPL